MTQNPQMKILMAFSSKHILLALLAEDQSQEQGSGNKKPFHIVDLYYLILLEKIIYLWLL